MVAFHQPICRHRVCWSGAFAREPHMNKLTHFHRWDWVGRRRHFWSVSAEGRIWKLKNWKLSAKLQKLFSDVQSSGNHPFEKRCWRLVPIFSSLWFPSWRERSCHNNWFWTCLKRLARQCIIWNSVEQSKTKCQNETVTVISVVMIQHDWLILAQRYSWYEGHLDLPTNGTRLSTVALLNPQPPQHGVGGGFILMEVRQSVMCRISKIWGQLRMKMDEV